MLELNKEKEKKSEEKKAGNVSVFDLQLTLLRVTLGSL
jgi:hypothetical protein